LQSEPEEGHSARVGQSDVFHEFFHKFAGRLILNLRRKDERPGIRIVLQMMHGRVEHVFPRRNMSRGFGPISDYCSEIEDQVVVYECAAFFAFFEILCIGPKI
jgi:hypothetical protein